MRILIVNDDGVGAAQLPNLIRWCRQFGEVTTFVPKFEQSGKSHSFEIHRDFEVQQVQLTEDITVWTVDSTPADCVRFAILGMHEQFDLVISGINRGLNIGQDIIYSGTVSAAMEAVALGTKALALSTEPETFDDAIAQLDHIWDFFTENDCFSKCSLWNVNIPLKTTGELRVTRQGGPYYSDDFLAQPGDMYLPQGKDIFMPRDNSNFDTDCVLRMRHISITPLTIDRTDRNTYELFKQ